MASDGCLRTSVSSPFPAPSLLTHSIIGTRRGRRTGTSITPSPTWRRRRRRRSFCLRVSMVSSQRTTAAASTSTNNSSVRFDVPAHLKRSGMKTMNVVQLVESSSSLEAPPILRKSRRLVASTLLDALDDRIRKRKWQAALKVFQLLKEQEWYEPDTGTHIKIIDMLGKCKQASVAFSVFRLMIEEKCIPTVEAYTALLSAYTRSNLLDKAFIILEEMKKTPYCHPDIYTYSELIRACSEVKDLDRVCMLLSEMQNIGLTPNTVTYNILIDAYGKAGMFEDMENLFMEMVKGERCRPDAWTQNAMLRCYAKARNIERMEYWYAKILSFGYRPNVITFNTLLDAYGKECMFERLELVLDFMHKYCYRGTTVTYNTVINAYGKAGCIEKVRNTYKEMVMQGVKEDARTFCSLIDAHGKLGFWKKVEKLLRQMRNLNIEPDIAVYNAALDAYRRAGRKVEMHRVLVEMEDQGIEGDKYTEQILGMALSNREKMHSGI